MNWSVELPPALKRTSLIFTAIAFRTLAVLFSNCARAAFVHSALAVRTPALVVAGERTVKVAHTLAPGATGPPNVFGIAGVHPVGGAMLKLTPVAAERVVFVNVKVMSCVDLGVNVVTRDRLSRCTSYLAATM